MAKPLRVAIRTYQVGFGDCFLLSFAYRTGPEKHVLVDFGSTKLPDGAPKTRMMDIAADIKARCGGEKLTAVIATHRHQDHISGFGGATGAVIAELEPQLVIQPWTEDPDLAVDATGPATPPGQHAMALERHSLAAMQAVSRNYVAESRRNHQYLRGVSRDLREQLNFVGEDNIANPAAVRNLIAMGHAKGKGEYLHAGMKTKLAKMLGLTVDVFGPPTVEQSAAIKSQRSRDSGEFWQLAASAPQPIESDDGGKAKPLFPEFVQARQQGQFPAEARWLIYRLRTMRGNQMLSIVRMLDTAMNNTSLILLFRSGSKSLLFPGDAQIENWQYAFAQSAWMSRLKQVDLYKVGHHGSLNATPKTLWGAFAKKSENPAAPGRLATLMSTVENKHGNVDSQTEVPRRTLVDALRKESDFYTTQSLTGAAFWHDSVVELG